MIDYGPRSFPASPLGGLSTPSARHAETLQTARLAGAPRSPPGQHVEADLLELAIGREDGRQLQFAPPRHAGAIGERPILGSMGKKQLTRPCEPTIRHPLPSTPRRPPVPSH